MADLAAQLAGLVTVPIHLAYDTPTLAFVIADCTAHALFVSHSQLAKVLAACAYAPTQVSHVVVIDDESAGAAAREAVANAPTVANISISLLTQLTHNVDAFAAYGEIYTGWQARDLYALSYTSGSTGVPKGVMEVAAHFQQKPSAFAVQVRLFVYIYIIYIYV